MEQEYVLGTHDEEIERLGLQHGAWRALVLSAWRRAGLARGNTVLDVGSGPGVATMELAALVGAEGRVIAVDQSARFLARIESDAATLGFPHVETFACDLSVAGPPASQADLAWCRWIFAFVHDPAGLVRRIHRALRPGGRLVVHEYFDYATWRMMPRCAELNRFVAAVIDSWRPHGGEPDVAIDLPSWMADAGFVVESIRPHVFITTPQDQIWEWPSAFVYSGLSRLVESLIVGSSNPQFLNGLRLHRPHWTISATGPLFNAGTTPRRSAYSFWSSLDRLSKAVFY